MKITKFGHACFVVEHAGQSLVVDPGEYSIDLVIPGNVSVVVVTHVHADHLSEELIRRIIERNPSASIVGHPDVTAKLDAYTTRPVQAGDTVSLGSFNLEFFGGQHAIIAPSWPTFANLGVMINDHVYYPGDSFTIPERTVKLLALPAAAPWLKISEAMDFLQAVKPNQAFPVHDAILSNIGKDLHDRMLKTVAHSIGTVYARIDDSPLEA